MLREHRCQGDGRGSLTPWKARCWGGVLVLHPEQPGLAPTFQGIGGTGFSSDASVTEHQLYTGKAEPAAWEAEAHCRGDAVFLWAPRRKQRQLASSQQGGGSLGSGGGLVPPPPTASSPRYSLISWDGSPLGVSAQVRSKVSATSQSGCSERESDWLSSSLVGLEKEMATHSSIPA